jgi:putative ABC transport system permease protein
VEDRGWKIAILDPQSSTLCKIYKEKSMNTLWQDLRFAIRTFVKQPGFAMVAIITLALGIGANSAIFSVINGVLLKPLPFKQPENVVKLWESMANGFQGSVSAPNLKDWREQNTVFTRIAAYQFQNFGLESKDAPERVRAATVSAEFFDVLGVPPQLGRTIAEGEDQEGKHRVAVLSDQLWQSKFAGDRGIVGKTILLGGENYTVIGVMPANFRYPSRLTDLWVPLVMPPQQFTARGSHFLLALARLKPGVTFQQAQEQMSAIAHRIELQYPDNQTGRGALLIQAQEEIVRGIRPALLTLLAAVGLVLLIACTNVANLLLARAATRRREIAIRLALGAGRWRLLRQLLTESALLSLLGGAIGLVLAYWGVAALVKLATGILPRANEVTLDGRVAAFTIVLSLLTGIVFGLAPALQASKAELQSDLKEGSAAAGNQQSNLLRSLLVVGEVAAALVLLIGASLLIKSFARLQHTESGLRPENVLTAGITLPDSKYKTTEAISQFHKRMLERVSSLPGVQSAGIISKLPLQEYGYNGGIQIEGQPPPPPGSRDQYVEFRAVSPDYFRTFGIPLLAGRMLDERDQSDTALSLLVNETVVRRLFSGQPPLTDAIGKYVTVNNSKYQIVGVVGDVKQSGLVQPTRPEIYWPYPQSPDTGLTGSVALAVRATGEPTALTAAVRNAVLAVDPAQPIHNVKAMEEVIADSVSDRRLNTLLLTLFAAVALLLALIGVYSVMSYLVAQNTREIGIRIALGAQVRDVLRLVVGQGMVLTLIGIAMGIALSFALTRLMDTLLFGVTATDPTVFVAAPLIILVVALLACHIPAWRATKVDPILALRYE